MMMIYSKMIQDLGDFLLDNYELIAEINVII